MHTIAELLEAAAIRLGSASANDLGRALGLRGTLPGKPITTWRQGKGVPRDKFCVPIAQALGIDADYVMACLVVARRRRVDLAYWRKRANRKYHPAAIDTVNALLAKAADTCEREGREQMLLARMIRTRAHSILPLDWSNGVHSVLDLIHALEAKFDQARDVVLTRALGVSRRRLLVWRRGEHVPNHKSAVPLAHALGIDPQYALVCLALAADGDTGALACQTDPGHYRSSIRTVNSLLEKSATHFENEARLQLQTAEQLRARLRDG
jgi:hypothetical protein